jgi:hypothetical protein
MHPTRLFAALAVFLFCGSIDAQAGRLEWRNDRFAIDFSAMWDSVLLYPVLGFDARSVGPIRQPGVLGDANSIDDEDIDAFEDLDLASLFDSIFYGFRDLPIDIMPIYPPDSPFLRPVLYLPDPVLAAVPEPSAALAFGTGVLLVGGFLRRRAHKTGSARLAQ